ncbi:MAG TPA: hypothetical protein VGV86_10270, partial [Acidimicrobiales bacterium]|nr:hypothetical protein [Acidimicrobiales bacterium]
MKVTVPGHNADDAGLATVPETICTLNEDDVLVVVPGRLVVVLPVVVGGEVVVAERTVVARPTDEVVGGAADCPSGSTNGRT